MVALVDPGSEISLISEQLVRRKGLVTQELQGTYKIVTADNQLVAVDRWIPRLKFWVAEWVEEHPVVVIPSLIQPLVLGMDWMAKRAPRVDWVTGKMRVLGCKTVWEVQEAEKGTRDEQLAAASTLSLAAAKKKGSPGGQGKYLVAVAQLATVTKAVEAPGWIQPLLEEFRSVFDPVGDVPCETPFKADIQVVGEAQPVRHPVSRLSCAQKEEVTRQVTKLLQQGLIRPSSSPWSARLVLVAKKDGDSANV